MKAKKCKKLQVEKNGKCVYPFKVKLTVNVLTALLINIIVLLLVLGVSSAL